MHQDVPENVNASEEDAEQRNPTATRIQSKVGRVAISKHLAERHSELGDITYIIEKEVTKPRLHIVRGDEDRSSNVSVKD